jgi:translation initiation factor 4A
MSSFINSDKSNSEQSNTNYQNHFKKKYNKNYNSSENYFFSNNKKYNERQRDNNETNYINKSNFNNNISNDEINKEEYIENINKLQNISIKSNDNYISNNNSNDNSNDKLVNNDINISNTNYTIETYEKWDDYPELQKNTSLLRGIYAYGFENPSPIQKKAIKPLMEGRDIIAQAQSGTGKTGCFTIGTLYRIDPNVNEVQAIVMAPTRELSRQIMNVFESISVSMTNVRLQLLVGGTSTDNDKEYMNDISPHIIIGCPGRIHDMLKRRFLNPKYIKIIVIDEADEMLSQGFKEQIYNIFQYLPCDSQVGLFSATIPSELNSLTEKFMRNPLKILVKSEMLTLDGIAQYYIALDNDNTKYETLKDLYSQISMSQCIIYCNSIKKVADLYEVMIQDGYPVCCIHSNMDKDERYESYKNFKNGTYRVLISSDVTARGIDIQQVSTVINFDIPLSVYTYLHRIGRSGRWGRKGVGINFVTKRDLRKMRDIERYYQTKIVELPASFCETNTK